MPNGESASLRRRSCRSGATTMLEATRVARLQLVVIRLVVVAIPWGVPRSTMLQYAIGYIITLGVAGKKLFIAVFLPRHYSCMLQLGTALL